MIPNDESLRGKMIQKMLDTIQRNTSHLTEWEAEFIDSIASQFAVRGKLSNKQCEILERIYDGDN